MKQSLLKLFFSAFCCLLLSLNCAKAQEAIELPEIKGTFPQVHQEIEIKFTGIKRLEEYQPVWRESGRPRGRKIIAESGFEIALVNFEARSLSDKAGFNVNHFYLFDVNGKGFEAQTRAFSIGTGENAKSDANRNRYEIPVIIPAGTKISAVQLWQFTTQEIQPLMTFQKITFDVSRFDW